MNRFYKTVKEKKALPKGVEEKNPIRVMKGYIGAGKKRSRENNVKRKLNG